MKNTVKIENEEFERQFESQREEKKAKISFFYKKERGVKLLDNRAITAAKVATFNDRGKVSGYYFATI
ncbi:hypothetical protein H8S77_17300 [Parabacteroides sp. BX2]|jgi:hypothetical protein|uniref:Uncharacterized protein n=1 Tax=Parabacteroides segnis TaxID=2763058 RepID=A0ABR7E4C8_9BACT|nr:MULTISPECIES: hypothetical protein [Parabacteroides]MBC5644637.1 hypothetical protein [Parabacteroides segnis]MCM0714118.1 hypothetical protein [Parabacteroides sp. TA-V-105]